MAIPHETQSRPQKHCKIECADNDANLNTVCENSRDLSIKQALNKIDLSKLRENVSEPDDYGI